MRGVWPCCSTWFTTTSGRTAIICQNLRPVSRNAIAHPGGRGLSFDGPDSDGMRRFFCDNALTWMRDYHIDGLRLDAVHAIIDTSAETFLEQLSIEVEQLEARLGRHLGAHRGKRLE